MFWLLVLALLLLTRIPVAAQYLSIDNVNLAFALETFDPRIHQPQPPGYPFFVFFARLINVFFHDAETTFLVISVLVSALCFPVIHALGKRMFDPWVGKAAVLLLLVNPVFWHSGLDGPLRPNLALFSLLAAYCAWRAWNGEDRFALWCAFVVGVGSGFRPDLLAFLGPLWFASACMSRRPVQTVIKGGILLSVVVLAWIGALAYAVGGVREMVNLFQQYTVEQSQGESVVLGASARNWLHQVNRLVIWNGLAIIGWIWAVPLVLANRKRIKVFGKETTFFIVWLLPGLVVQALIHVAAPGHTLFSIPAFCLFGAYVLHAGLQRWQASDWALASVVAANVLLFLNFVPLPGPESTGGIRDAMAVGTFETSLENIRWLDNIHGSSLKEIREFSPEGREVVVVTQDAQQKEWFLNWRIARYYHPNLEFRVLASQKTPPEVVIVRGNKTVAAQTGSPLEIRVPARARILWLVGADTPLRKALDTAVGHQGGQRILYTDIHDESEPFRILDLLIVPEHGIQ